MSRLRRERLRREASTVNNFGVSAQRLDFRLSAQVEASGFAERPNRAQRSTERSRRSPNAQPNGEQVGEIFMQSRVRRL